MTHRELPVAQWPRLRGTSLSEVWPILDPARTRVLVVEDSEGGIVACWAFLWAWHAEGLWIREDHRGKTAAARHLLTGLREAASAEQARAVVTAAVDPWVAALIDHAGGQPLPSGYAIPLRPKEPLCQPQ